MKVLEELNKMIAAANDIAEKQGLQEKNLSDNHYLMMIITEIVEAIQADRSGNKAMMKSFNVLVKEKGDDANFIFPDGFGKERENFIFAYEKYIEGTVDGELADIVIRTMSFFGLRGMKFSPIEDLDASKAKESEEYFKGCSFTEAALYLTQSFATHYDGLYKDKVFVDDLSYSVAFIFEWARYLKIDLMRHIKLKMKYNSMREYKHGKKY